MSTRPNRDLPVGTLLRGEDFEIRGVLGIGGTAITYLGWHRRFEQTVAIKEFFPKDFVTRSGLEVIPKRADEPSDIEFVEIAKGYFREEATKLQELNVLNDPCIVKVLRVFEENNTIYIVQEYIEGKTLSFCDRFTRQEDVMAWLEPICHVLQRIHSAGVLHRDVAPDNIILRAEDDTPVLIDFGAARMEFLRNRGLHTKLRSSKSGYSPPEAYGEGLDYTPAYDIFSLAATVHWAMTGERRQAMPFTAPTDWVPAGFTKTFCQAIDRAMAFDPDRRPQEALAFLATLKAPHEETRLMRNPPVRRPPELPTGNGRGAADPRAVGRRRMRRFAMFASGGLATTVAAGLLWLGIEGRLPGIGQPQTQPVVQDTTAPGAQLADGGQEPSPGPVTGRFEIRNGVTVAIVDDPVAAPATPGTPPVSDESSPTEYETLTRQTESGSDADPDPQPRNTRPGLLPSAPLPRPGAQTGSGAGGDTVPDTGQDTGADTGADDGTGEARLTGLATNPDPVPGAPETRAPEAGTPEAGTPEAGTPESGTRTGLIPSFLTGGPGAGCAGDEIAGGMARIGGADGFCIQTAPVEFGRFKAFTDQMASRNPDVFVQAAKLGAGAGGAVQGVPYWLAEEYATWLSKRSGRRFCVADEAGLAAAAQALGTGFVSLPGGEFASDVCRRYEAYSARTVLTGGAGTPARRCVQPFRGEPGVGFRLMEGAVCQ